MKTKACFGIFCKLLSLERVSCFVYAPDLFKSQMFDNFCSSRAYDIVRVKVRATDLQKSDNIENTFH